MKQVIYILFLFFSLQPTWATTFTVINTNDVGLGSFRQAIADANADASATSATPHIINFATTPGFPVFIGTVLPVIGNHMTINGISSGVTIQRSGAGFYRIFDINAFTVVLNNIEMTNGDPGGGQPGGAIRNNGGNLTLNNCIVRGNFSGTFANGHGGGIYQGSGTITINNSTIKNNDGQSNGAGGGMYVNAGTATLRNCTVANNQTSNNGGAIYVFSGATLHLINCTVVYNKSGFNSGIGSGGVFTENHNTLHLTNTILANNSVGILVFIFFSDLNSSSPNPPATNNQNIVEFCLIGGGAASCPPFASTVDPMLPLSASICGWQDIYRPNSGSFAIDNGTTTGAPTADICGTTWFGSIEIGNVESIPPGKILALDGIDNYIDISTPFTTFTNEISVEAWVNVFTLTSTRAILGQGTADVDNMGTNVWLLEMNSVTDKISFYVNDGGTWRIATSTTPITGNGWMHIVGTASPTGVKLWVNGILEGSTAGISSGIQSNGFASMQIGKDIRFAAGPYMFGWIDEVRVWNEERCLSKITGHMGCELVGNETNLVAYYDFNQGEADGANSFESTLLDRQINTTAHHGTLTNMALSGSSSNWTDDGNGHGVIGTCSPNLPEIDVQGNGTSIVNNDVTPSLADHTNFGSTSTSVIRTFTIENTGTAPLIISSILIGGANATEFTLGALTPTSPIGPGSSATFTVTFAPGAGGLRTAFLGVFNDDCDEGTYIYNIQGTGLAPANDLCSGAELVVDDGTCVPGTLVLAGDDIAGLIGCQVGASNPEVWYKFVASAPDLTVLINAAWSGNVDFAILQNTACGLNTLVVANCTSSPSLGTFNSLVPGTTYYMVVSKQGIGGPGAFTICMQAACPNNNTFNVDLTPVSAGTTNSNPCIKPGEYVTVNVQAGEKYKFSTCNNFSVDNTELSLYDNLNNKLAYNNDDCGLYSEIQWTATFTGQVRLLLDETIGASPCQSSSTCIDVAVTWVAPNTTCATIAPICVTGTSSIFKAYHVAGSDAVADDPTNVYAGCFATAPNPTWHLLEVTHNGTVALDLTASTDNIDAIVWGPFTSAALAMSACGSLGDGGAGANFIDCRGIPPSMVRNVFISNAAVGTFYVMMVSSTATVDQDISIVQSSGVGKIDCTPYCNQIFGHALYWSESGSSSVRVFDIPTTYAVTAASPIVNPTGIAMDSATNTLYWVENGMTIYKQDLPCGAIIPFVTAGLSNVMDLELDATNGKLYWADQAAGLVKRINIDGTNEQLVLSGLAMPSGLDIDPINGKLYVTEDIFTGTINESNLDGSGFITLNPSTQNPRDLVVDAANSKMYWTSGSRIMESNIDGTGAGQLVGVLSGPFGIDMDHAAGVIYFSELGPNQIKKMNTDGSGLGIVASVLSAPLFVSLASVSLLPPPATALHFDGLNDYIDAGTDASLDLANMITIEAWVNIPASAAEAPFVYRGGDGGGGYQMYTSSVAGSGLVGIRLDGVPSIDITAIIPTGTWTHVAATWDAVTTDVNLYVNGVVVNTTTMGGPISSYVGNMYLGTNSLADVYSGLLDEVRIWERALCEGEINFNMNCELLGTEPSLNAYYDFNQGIDAGSNPSETIVFDKSFGGANDGTLTNFTLNGPTSNWIDGGNSTISGTCGAFPLPEIALVGNSIEIIDGHVTPILADHTNFGTVTVGTGFVRTFTIENNGVDPLTVNTINVFGGNAGDFVIGGITVPVVISPGSFTTFTITLTASATGIRSTTVNISNDDCDESPYDFAVQGSAPPPLSCALVTATPSVVCIGGTVNLLDGNSTSTAWMWDGPNSFTSTLQSPTVSPVTLADSGTYNITITDGGSNITCSVDITVESGIPTLAVTSNYNGADVSCVGSTDGQITATPTGTPPHTYAWSANAGGQSTSVIIGIGAGTYVVTMTTGNGCQGTASIVISDPPTLTITLGGQTNIACKGDATGSATVAGGGGTGAYTYNWSIGQTTATATGLLAGTHNVQVTDANGCTAQMFVMITEPTNALTVGIGTNNISCFGLNDGDATATSGGGTGGHTFLWNVGSQTTAVITGLAPGNYSLTVTDANSCTATASQNISGPAAALLASIVSAIDPTCSGGNDGSAVVAGGNGTPGYTQLWSNGQTTQLATGLIAGNYTVTVTDANSCTATTSVTINPGTVVTPPIIPNIDICVGDLRTLTVAGGPPPGTYKWYRSNAHAIADITALTTSNSYMPPSDPGTRRHFFVTRTNAAGCISAPTEVTIIQRPNLTLPAITGPANVCVGGTNTYTVTTPLVPETIVDTAMTNFDLVTEYVWSTTAGWTITAGQGTETITVDAPSVSGPATISVFKRYVLPISAGGQCNSVVRNDNVNVRDKPIIDIAPDPANVCEGQPLGINGGVIFAPGGVHIRTWTGSTGILNATNIQSPTVVASTPAGSYDVIYTLTVSLSGGGALCTSIPDTQTVVVNPAPALSFQNQINVSCFGAGDGSVEVVAAGATTPYTYFWSTGGQTTSVATGLAPGTRFVTVTDANGCTSQGNVTITQPSFLSGSITVTQPSCNGGSDATATATFSGGTTPYTYQWSLNASGQTTAFITGLSAGSYFVTMTDFNGCTITRNGTIGQPTTVGSSILSNQPTCNGGSDGSAIANGSGGTPTYTYLWSPSGQTNSTATGLITGTYVVTVTDVNGCTVSRTAIVGQPSAVTATISSVADITCNGANDGQATANGTGGVAGGHTYLWSVGGQTTQMATGLPVGVHTVTVSDANSCTSTANVTITEPSALTATISSSTPVLCFGQSNGTATSNVSGGTPGYTYIWTAGQTSANVTGLSVGIHCVTVSDANLCKSVACVTITQPASVLTTSTAVTTPISCNGAFDGAITTTPTGGAPGYFYQWDAGAGSQTTATATGLFSSTYDVTITDANGCTISTSIFIFEPTAVTATISSQTNVSCFGASTGTATASGSGGTPSYTFLWSANAASQTTAQATGLSAGVTYCVTVTDANSCSAAAVCAILTQPASALTANITGQVDVKCFGESTGTATANGIGGTSPYTYLWNAAAANQITAQATGLAAGPYNATVTDNVGCTFVVNTTISQPATALMATISPPSNISCNGANDGAATANGLGGTPSYTYLWSASAGGQTAANATGLPPGAHTVTVTDMNSCTDQESVTITQPSLLLGSVTVTQPSCNGGSDGTATAVHTGGTPSFTYVWTPNASGQTTATITGLSMGNHRVTITDMNGCTITRIQFVGEPSILGVTTAPTPVSCNGGNNGSAVASPTGGTPTYTFLWSVGGQTNSTATGLNAGTHFVTVTDANGCTISTSVIITEPSAVTATIPSASNVSCNGGNNGSATAIGAGGNPGYTYQWDAAAANQTDAMATGLAANVYCVTVTDMNLCSDTECITITEPSAVTATIAPFTDITCNGANDGTATATGAGGTGGHTYLWSVGGQTSSMATGLPAGVHTVTVSDANTCMATVNVTITNPTILGVLVTSTPVCNTNDGTATANPSGGTAGYFYVWDDALVQTTPTAIGLTVGTYNVTVTDVNGCIATGSTNVLPAYTSSAVINNHVSCNGGNDGQATINQTASGVPPFTYTWSHGTTTGSSVLGGLSAGTYTVTVADAGFCTAITSLTITEPATIVTTSITSFTTITCNGGSNGTATANGLGGTGVHTYLWSVGGQTNQTATGLPAGIHTVTVSDANSCEATANVTITEPSAVTATISGQMDVNCNGGTDGTATASGLGGTPTYTFLWSVGGQTNPSATGLPAGVHTVTVSDANSCAATTDVTITEPSAITAILSPTDVNCYGDSTGQINATATGGTPSYTYLWGANANNQTSQTATGLKANISYCVTITDAFSCSDVFCQTLTEPSPFVVSAAVTTNYNGFSVSCFGDANGDASATAIGGVAPITFTWSNSTTGSVNTNIGAGLYSVTATDFNGCQTIDTITLTQPTILSNTLINTTNVTCFGGSNGSITYGGIGGVPAYSYLWSDGQNTATATGLSVVGNPYLITITDANGCQIVDNAFISQPAGPVATPDLNIVDDYVCPGDSIVLFTTATGVTYEWNGPAGFYSTASSVTIHGVSSAHGGAYSLHVTDVNGCVSADSIASVNVFVPITTSIMATNLNGMGDICFGEDINFEYGASCDSFVWVGPVQVDTTNAYDPTIIPTDPNYVTGIWTMKCVDNVAGCASVSDPFFVNLLPTPPTPTPTSSGPVCFGDSVNLSTPMVLAANTTWYSDAAGLFPVGYGPNITVFGITTDTTFYVNHLAAGCLSPMASILVTVNPIPFVQNAPADFSVCEGDVLNLSASTGVSQTWTHIPSSTVYNQTNVVINPVTSADGGLYSLAITDANGCQSLDTFVTVTVNINPVAPPAQYNTPLCDGDNLVLFHSGGCDETRWQSPTGGVTIFNTDTFTLASTHPDYAAGLWVMVCRDLTTTCFDTSRINVIINPTVPVLPTTNNGPVCYGDSARLGVALLGGASYTWYVDAGFSLPFATGPYPSVYNLTQDSTFYVEVSKGGCSSVSQTTVQVYPPSSKPNVPADFTVCEGDVINMVFNMNANGFLWTRPTGGTFTTSSFVIPNATLADNGNYFLGIVDSNGCTVADTFVNITVTPKPLPPTISSPSICQGETLILTVLGGCDTVQWIGPAITFYGPSSVSIPFGNANYIDNGSWTARCVDTTGALCASVLSSSHTVSIKPMPTQPFASNNGPICVGEGVEVSTPNNGETYTWYAMDTTTLVGNGAVVNIPNITTDTAFLVIVELNGCFATDSTQVFVLPVPPAPIAPDTVEVCQLDSILLSTSTTVGVTGYLWSGPNGFMSNQQNPFIYPATAANDGFYSLIIKDANSCPSPAKNVRVIVHAPPVAPVLSTPNTSVCHGDTIFINSDKICGQMLWQGPSAMPFFGTDSLVIDSFNMDYLNGNWTVICVDTVTGCESISNTLTFNIKTLPDQPIITSNSPICVGENANLSMSLVSGAIYRWFSMDSVLIGTGSTITISGLTNDTSFVGVVEVNGCSNFDVVSIIVNPLPATPDITVLSDTICAGNFIQFNTTDAGPIYNWSGPNGFTAGNSNPFILSATPINTGTYFLNVVDNNGCQSLDTSVFVVVNPTPPTPVIAGTTSICAGDSIYLHVASACDKLTWFTPLSTLIVVIGDSTLTVDDTYAGNWQVLCEDTLTGCSSIVSNAHVVNLSPAPAPVVPTNNGPVCINESVTLSIPQQATSTYVWFADAALTDTVGFGTMIMVDSISVDSTFYVQVTNASGCSLTGSTLVLTHPIPIAPLITVVDSIICEGENIQLGESNGLTHFWTGPNGFVSNNQSPLITGATTANSGFYIVQATDVNGCLMPLDSINILVNAPPTTPVISGGANICDGDTLILTSNVTCDSSEWVSASGNFAGVGNQLIILPYALGYSDPDWVLICYDTTIGCSAVSNIEYVNYLPAPTTPTIAHDPSTCFGDSTTLTTPTILGATNTWYADSTLMTVIGVGNSIDIRVITDTTVYLVQTVGACTAPVASATIMVLPTPPTPVIVNSVIVVCEGDVFQLATTTTPANAYLWTHINGFSSTAQNPFVGPALPTDAGTYTLALTDVNGCAAPLATIQVTVNPLPVVPTIFVANPNCDSDTMSFGSNNPLNVRIEWVSPSIDTIAGIPNMQILPTDPNYLSGLWTVIFTDTTTGCAITKDTTIQITMPPAAGTIVNSGPVCLGSSVTLTSSSLAGVVSYNWFSADTTFIGTGQSITIPNIVNDTAFALAVTTTNGCNFFMEFDSVFVLPEPAAPSIIVNAISCEGEDIVFNSATNATNYNWSGPNGFTAFVRNPVISPATVLNSGLYTLSYYDANGCLSLDSSIVITINALPTAPTASTAAFICAGDTLFLNSSAGSCDSAYWVGPTVAGVGPRIAGGSIFILSNSPDYLAGNWQVFCVDTTTGCETGSNVVNVNINAAPNAIAVNNGPVCINEMVQLTAGFVSGATYEWFADAALSNSVGTGQVVLVDSISVDSTFYVVVTDANGCRSIAAATTVTVKTPLAPPTVGADIQVCEGDNFTLTSGLGFGYNWRGPNGFVSSQWNPTIVNATTAHTGTYTLSVIGINGCPTRDTTIQVTVDTVPLSPTITPFIYLCAGDTLYLSADSTSNHCDSVYWVGPNGATMPIGGRNLAIARGDTNYVSGLWQLHCVDTTTNCSSVSNFSVVLISPSPDTQAVSNTGPICMGGAVTLSTGTALNFPNYTWYADSTLTNIAATGQNAVVNGITSDSTFYLVITNSGGCTSDAIPNLVIVLPPSVAPVVPADTQYCAGEVIALSTNPAAQYFWSSPNGFVSNAQNPTVTLSASVLDSGIYTLVVMDANGCLSAAASMHVTVNASPPTPTITSNSPICDGDTLFLNSTGICDQAQWIGPLGNTALGSPGSSPLWTYGASTAIDPLSASYQNSNWFMICMDTTTGCQATSNTIAVTITPSPAFISVSNSGAVCTGNTATLTAAITSTANVVWYADAGLTTVIGSGSTVTSPTLTATTTFYVVATDPTAGCSTLDSTVVVVNPILSSPVITTNTNLCAGDSLTLTTATAAGYNWSGPNGFSSTAQSPVIFPATVFNGGAYTLSILDANGCPSFDTTLTIIVNALPTTPAVVNNSPSCTGSSVTLSASPIAGATYEWFHLPLGTSVGLGQTLTIPNLTLADTGYYYVVATIGSCSATSGTTLVTIYTNTAAAPDAGTSATLCGVDTTTLNAVVPTTGTIGAWTTTSGAVILNSTSATTFVANLQVGANVFYWTLSNTTCAGFATDSVIITVNTQSTNIANAGANQTLCGSSTTTLAANTATGVSTGSWSQSAAQAALGVGIANSTDPATSVTGLAAGSTYTFVWTLTNGSCGTPSTDTVLVTIGTATGTAIAGGDIVTCSQDTVALAATNPASGTGMWTTNSSSSAVIITPNQNNTIVTNLTQGTTMFIWTLSDGVCANYAEDTMYVTIGGASPIANADVFSVAAGNSSIIIDVLPNDNLTSSWDIYINTPMNNGQMINLNNGQFDLNLQGVTTDQQFIYELCNPSCPSICDTALVTVEIQQLGICDIPNIFTPNGDGVNDNFDVPCLNTITNAWLVVFNRWGDQVYETDSYQNQWDGTMNGQALPDGTYYYIIKIGANEQVQGFVEIRR